jgi:hypothetical protein
MDRNIKNLEKKKMMKMDRKNIKFLDNFLGNKEVHRVFSIMISRK